MDRWAEPPITLILKGWAAGNRVRCKPVGPRRWAGASRPESLPVFNTASVLASARETKLPRQHAEFSDDILNATKQIVEVINGYDGSFNNLRPVPSNGVNLCRFGRRSAVP